MRWRLLQLSCGPANLQKRTPVWSCEFPKFSRIVTWTATSELKKLCQCFSFTLVSPSSTSGFLNVICSKLLRSSGEISLKFNRCRRSSFSSNRSSLSSSVITWCTNWLTLCSIINVISNENLWINFFFGNYKIISKILSKVISR